MPRRWLRGNALIRARRDLPAEAETPQSSGKRRSNGEGKVVTPSDDDIAASLTRLRYQLITEVVNPARQDIPELRAWRATLRSRIEHGTDFTDASFLRLAGDKVVATRAELEASRNAIREQIEAHARATRANAVRSLRWYRVLSIPVGIVGPIAFLAAVILVAYKHPGLAICFAAGLWPLIDSWIQTNKVTELEILAKAADANADKETAKLRNILNRNLKAEYERRRAVLSQDINEKCKKIQAACDVTVDRAGPMLWEWNDDRWKSFMPPSSSRRMLRFGRYSVSQAVRLEVEKSVPGVKLDVAIPALACFPTGRPLYFAGSTDRLKVVRHVQGVLARMMATTLPGRLRFVFIDPVGRGQNVADFMHLGDYDEKLITSKAWTEPEQIEQRLKDLTEHLENVIQKYLRNQFATIEEYNEHAQEIAEPYRVLVVFDYDVAFTDAAAKRLHSLVEAGPRCGIFPIIVAGKPDSRPWPGALSVVESQSGTTVVGYPVFGSPPRAGDSSNDPQSSQNGLRPTRPFHIRVGETYDGIVKSIQGEVARLQLGPSQEGSLHVSQISRSAIASPGERLKIGDHIRVKVRLLDADGWPRLTMIDVEQPKRSDASTSNVSDPFSFEFEPGCAPGILGEIVTEVGRLAQENMVVAVPYAKVLTMAGIDPDRPEQWWKADGHNTKELSTADGIEIPLGPTGAQKLQTLVLGKGTAHHVLIAGRTGSGKSNLLHVVITTLALKYSPREVELFLVDFKKGVEFKAYANHRLPHAHVIAIESEREFGLSVLRGLDRRMQERGEGFRRAAANDIAEFRQKSGDEVPRIVLIVDEFHEFFSIDDAVATEAASLLDRLVRQGRSFGIHVILGSQSLAGASMLPRSTLDQMQIRIALPCSAADSRLILADDNESARLLSRAGEAIYNAASGLEEGNHFFQVALFDDEVRDKLLGELESLAKVDRRPIVFEGHDPADLMFCEPLKALLRTGSAPVSIDSVPVWVGEPITLDPPVELRFRRQSGSNAVVVTRDEEQAMGVITACLLSMASGVPPSGARFAIIDLSTTDAPWAGLCEDMVGALPHQVEIVQRRDIPHRLRQLCDEIYRRSSDDSMAGRWTGFLIIVGLHRARDLRVDDGSRSSFDSSRDGPSPTESLSTILREGPESGIHTLVWCDNYPNLVRAIDTRGLREFGYRIAGSMSQDESMRLLDDVKASLLDRPHRMVFYDDSSAGSVRVFRPYQLPTPQWLQTVAGGLRHRYEQEKRG